MAWPQTVDYNAVLQNPADCFRDPDLAQGQPADGMMLWTAYDNEENVLFREADFKDPDRSRRFARLLALPDPDAVALVGRLMQACREPLEQTSLVGDLLAVCEVAPPSEEPVLKGEVRRTSRSKNLTVRQRFVQRRLIAFCPSCHQDRPIGLALENDDAIVVARS